MDHVTGKLRTVDVEHGKGTKCLEFKSCFKYVGMTPEMTRQIDASVTQRLQCYVSGMWGTT